MDYAAKVFDQMSHPSSFVWNTMIRCLQQKQEPRNALSIFDSMRAQNVRPDHFTFPFAVRACADSKDHRKGVSVHCQSFKAGLELDVFVGTSLMEFYGAFGDLGSALQVFDEMDVKDLVTWTTILSVHVNQFGHVDTARRLFDAMPVKDLIAWNMMIGGYVKAGEVELAEMLFHRAPIKDLLMYNTLLSGYAKHGNPKALLHFFSNMPETDLVSWNTVIGGLVHNKRINEAVTYFQSMQMENVRPNEVTVVTILSACAQYGGLDIGRWLHSYVNRSNLSLNVVVGTAVVDMYMKCGELESAEYVFNKMPNRDVVAWNAMIMGFSMNGQSRRALDFFDKMKNEDVYPNDVSILGVLCACTHAGLVDEGRKCFDIMCCEMGLKPNQEHYGCMVDLLGRAGLLEEAYKLIRDMPLAPHTGVWGALLGACKIHSNVELAEIAIEQLIQLDDRDGGYLAIMSNIYASACRWDDVSRVRKLLKEKGLTKLRGCSSIEINGEIHEFGVEEKIHARTEEIFTMINEISMHLRMAGHIARSNEVFFDVEEEEKEKALFFHSEKMAVAFGLIATDKGSIIRVVKNLRICADCHSAIKLISRIYAREIVVRDRHRFHHFKEGLCSCRDYW